MPRLLLRRWWRFCYTASRTFEPVSGEVEDPQPAQHAQTPRDGSAQAVELQVNHLAGGSLPARSVSQTTQNSLFFFG